MTKKKPSQHDDLAELYTVSGAVSGLYSFARELDIVRMRAFIESRARPCDEHDPSTESGRKGMFAAIIKVLLRDADDARDCGDEIAERNAVFAAGALWGQWLVDRDRWRGVMEEFKLEQTRERTKAAKHEREQRAVAELRRRFEKSGRKRSKNDLATEMAAEKTVDTTTGKTVHIWGALSTLERYFRGIDLNPSRRDLTGK